MGMKSLSEMKALALNPPNYLLLPFTGVALTGTVLCLLTGQGVTFLGILMDTLCTLALLLWCLRLPRFIRHAKQAAEPSELLSRVPLLERCREDEGEAAKLKLTASVVLNFVYALFKMIMGFVTGSDWLRAIGSYYALLTVMRVLLLEGLRHEEETERSAWIRYLICAALLLPMTGIIIYVVVLLLRTDSTFSYPGVLIYAMAVYAFYAVIFSIRDLVRARRDPNPVVRSCRVVRSAAALVSMFSLEVGMLTAFGESDRAFRNAVIGVSGLVITVALIVTNSVMILRSVKELRKQNLQKSGSGAAM